VGCRPSGGWRDRVLQNLRNQCSITPERPLLFDRNGCSITSGGRTKATDKLGQASSTPGFINDLGFVVVTYLFMR